MDITFDEMRRVASSAEATGRAPLRLEERRSINALKLWAYHSLNTMIEQALELLDMMEGDPDLEDATGLEDAFEHHKLNYSRPGCPIADPDRCEDADIGENIDEREGVEEV